MQRIVLFALLLGAATFGFAEGNKFGLVFDGAIYNNTRTQTTKSDYVSGSLDLRVGAVIPLGETAELDPTILFSMYSTKDPSGLVTTAGTDYTQNGFGVGLAYYASVANSGPFTLLTGVSTSIRGMGIPSDSSGDWTYWNADLSLPIVFDVSLGSSFSLRVTQNVLQVYGRSKSYANVNYGFSSLQFNQFGPAIGCVVRF